VAIDAWQLVCGQTGESPAMVNITVRHVVLQVVFVPGVLQHRLQRVSMKEQQCEREVREKCREHGRQELAFLEQFSASSGRRYVCVIN